MLSALALSNRWLLINYIRATARHLADLLLVRLTDVKFISMAMGITLFLLAIMSGVEIFSLWVFRLAVIALERFLRNAFWLTELLLTVILACLAGGVVLISLTSGTQTDPGKGALKSKEEGKKKT